MTKLKIVDLHVSVEGKEILRGVDLEIDNNQIHAIMGPNGSGKSTLALTIMGHPGYEITKGRILIDDKDVNELSTDKRAQLGLFLSFQYPSEIPGVKLSDFLRTSYNTLHNDQVSVTQFREVLKENMKTLKMDDSFANRYLNEGFSGGEKKKSEILQLSILKPKIAILDETDSGLDIDALKVISEGVNNFSGKMGIIVITHYQRLLKYIKPDHIHVMIKGRIVKSGGHELAEELEHYGYENLAKGGDLVGIPS